MTRGLRRAHRTMFAVLAILLPVILWIGLHGRRQPQPSTLPGASEPRR